MYAPSANLPNPSGRDTLRMATLDCHYKALIASHIASHCIFQLLHRHRIKRYANQY